MMAVALKQEHRLPGADELAGGTLLGSVEAYVIVSACMSASCTYCSNIANGACVVLLVNTQYVDATMDCKRTERWNRESNVKWTLHVRPQ